MIVTHAYDDIISLPHHVSKNHPQMTMASRAAQFSPFAALTGLGAAIEETARLTETKVELSEEQKSVINEKLNHLAQLVELTYDGDLPTARITYFIPDDKKSGGAYVTTTGSIRKVDIYESALALTDGTIIPFENILTIEDT